MNYEKIVKDLVEELACDTISQEGMDVSGFIEGIKKQGIACTCVGYTTSFQGWLATFKLADVTFSIVWYPMQNNYKVEF